MTQRVDIRDHLRGPEWNSDRQLAVTASARGGQAVEATNGPCNAACDGVMPVCPLRYGPVSRPAWTAGNGVMLRPRTTALREEAARRLVESEPDGRRAGVPWG